MTLSVEVGIQRRIEGQKDLVFSRDDDIAVEAEDPSSSAMVDTIELDKRERNRFMKSYRNNFKN